MRVFVTGATGFIGSAVVRELIGAGHEVTGLARSDAAARSLGAAGARAHRGTVEDRDALRRGAAGADGVIHLAFFHAFGHASLATRLRVLFGGGPRGMVGRFLGAALEADRGAIEAMGTALAGPDRRLVAAFATMSVASSRTGTEDDAPDPAAPGGPRGATERTALGLADRGVRAAVVRLPPSVHGDGDRGFIPMLAGIARKKGVSAYVGDGLNRWPAVHRLDAARLFRLALERGEPTARYHAVADEGVPFREIATVIGRHLSLPIKAITPREAPGHFSFLAPFVAADNPASAHRTRDLLGWQPTQPDLIPDIDRPQYFEK